MTRKRSGMHHSALWTTLLCLVLLLRGNPSGPAAAVKHDPLLPNAALSPRPALAAALMAGVSMPPPEFAVMSSGDLSAALGTRQRHFGLFRPEAAVDPRRELLRRLPYGNLLAAAGQRHHVDSLLLAAVVEAESRFVAHAISPCGAVGLMQLLPSTGEGYGIFDLRDPSANIEAGSRYLRALLDRFQNRSDLALAAYNTGPEVVARYGCVPPFRETQDFVKRVLDRYGKHRRILGLDPAEPVRIAVARAARRPASAVSPTTIAPQPVVERAR
jgi:soluble lytic murein transglycosylase-like protein